MFGVPMNIEEKNKELLSTVTFYIFNEASFPTDLPQVLVELVRGK